MREHPTRDAYLTATSCPICANPLHGRTDQRYCTPACRQIPSSSMNAQNGRNRW